MFFDQLPNAEKSQTIVQAAKSGDITRFHLPRIALQVAVFGAAIAASTAHAVLPQEPTLPAHEIWQQSLRDVVEVIHESRGDIDGDGLPELAVCYRLPAEMREALAVSGDAGGLAVFAGNQRIQRPVFHAMFSDGTCDQLDLSRGILAFRSPEPENPQQATPFRWTYGRDFHFVGDEKTTLAAPIGERDEDISSLQTLQDGRLDSGWLVSEGSTGVGNKLRMRFPLPVRIGLVGVFGGTGSSRSEYRKNNRLHRISVRAKSAQQVANPAAQRGNVLLADAPRASYFVPPLAGVPMSSLEIRVEGVHLGKQTNDTKVGELEIVPLMELRSGVGVAGGYFRTSASLRDKGFADNAIQEMARGQNEREQNNVPAAGLFPTTNAKKLRTLETELDGSAESFEMDDF